jgi:hypothetical protein
MTLGVELEGLIASLATVFGLSPFRLLLYGVS